MATEVSLPVTRVVVMEDRAQVERQGVVTLPGGVLRAEVPGVSLLAVDSSLKVEVAGGTLIDARVVRRWRIKPQGGLAVDASELRRRERALADEVVVRADEVSRLSSRGEVLAQARADLLRAIAEQAGAGAAEPSRWKENLDTVTALQRKLEEELRAVRRDGALAQRLHLEAQHALAHAEEQEQDLEGSLALTLEGAGPAKVRLSYLVPCAVWRPAYRATLKADAVLLEAEAVIWQRTGEAWSDVELSLSTARPTLGTTPPRLTEDRLATRPKAAEEKRAVDVSLREETLQSSGEGDGGEAELPGLDDGGETRLLAAPTRCSVPSDGQPHRIPLSSFEARAQLELVCAAELTSLVSLVARFPNTGGQALLAGPVELVRQSGFVGRSQLKFSAAGETIKLSFGSEDGLRVVRHVDETREEARLTGRRTTQRNITLHISNASPDSAKLVIEERIPVSEVKEVEVQVLTRECQPPPAAISREGIARLEVQLPPNGTTKAKFAWELSAAAKVTGATRPSQ